MRTGRGEPRKPPENLSTPSFPNPAGIEEVMR